MSKTAVLPMLIAMPYPPSVNHYWRHVGTKVLISREGRAYAQEIAWRFGRLGKAESPVTVTVTLYPPDNRERDADNCGKALLDALVKAEVLAGDSNRHIKRLAYEWGEKKAGGQADVLIETYQGVLA